MTDFVMVDHTFDVPLDRDDPAGERISLYAREVRHVDGELRPWLLFLNGGPGFPAPRPLGNEGWLKQAVAGYRVLLLDQRGTGRSTPVTPSTPFADRTRLSDAFLLQVDRQLSWASANPLYFLLHEATYAQDDRPTAWSAHRVRAEHPEFDAAPESDAPVLFTGEMIYPWMLTDDPLLRPFHDLGHQLADRSPWPRLYDVNRLRANTVPVYANDMYIDRELSLDTANTIRGLQLWLTDEHEHDGLRASNGAVLRHLFDMAHPA